MIRWSLDNWISCCARQSALPQQVLGENIVHTASCQMLTNLHYCITVHLVYTAAPLAWNKAAKWELVTISSPQIKILRIFNISIVDFSFRCGPYWKLVLDFIVWRLEPRKINLALGQLSYSQVKKCYHHHHFVKSFFCSMYYIMFSKLLLKGLIF